MTGPGTWVPPFLPDREIFPFRSRWFESSVGMVHYIDEGQEGPPLLLLHGNPTWSFLYRGIVVRLRKHFRCIAPDYPGFGLSEHPEDYRYTPEEHASVVRELVRHLDLGGMTVMGQDWGGPIGMRLALDELDRLRALVMGNTWYWPPDAAQMKAFSYVMGSAPMQWMITERNFFVERMIPWGTKHGVAPEVMDHYRDCFPTVKSRVGIAELPRQILSSSFWLGEIADAVPRTLGHVPLLLTWGIGDLAFPSRMMDRFRADFRNVTVRRLDAKHFIQEDQPGEIAQAIQAFLSDGE
ncbi:MAG: alpha/beta fold hydrolase [Gemmatimonadota bacterium]|jgi:haloalkane dehalogenase